MEDVVGINATLKRGEIAYVNRKRGSLNRKKITINDSEWPAMSLIFLGFKAFGEKDGYLIGRYFFREAQMRDGEANVISFHDLPNHEPISSIDRQK